jgi:hypothetical protein
MSPCDYTQTDLDKALSDLSALYGDEFDSIKFQTGAKAMYEYLQNLTRDKREGGLPI